MGTGFALETKMEMEIDKAKNPGRDSKDKVGTDELAAFPGTKPGFFRI